MPKGDAYSGLKKYLLEKMKIKSQFLLRKLKKN